jgi:hypothetical protein
VPASAFGELVGVTRQVEQGLPEAGLVGVHRTEVRWAFDDNLSIWAPDVRISRIRLSDWLRHEAHETNH